MHLDTAVVCNTTWGVDGEQPVSLALNGATFITRATGTSGSSTPPSVAVTADLPQFTYVGLHPPALLEVIFTALLYRMSRIASLDLTSLASRLELAHC